MSYSNDTYIIPIQRVPVMKKVTIVIPVYNEADNVIPFYQTVSQYIDSLPFDFLFFFVDDGSQDNTVFNIQHLQFEHDNVLFIDFPVNRGKEAVIYDGLCAADGDYIILMDGDLQHPPELIPEMLRILDEGKFSAVGAKRKTKLFSYIFTFFFRLITRIKIEYGATDYMCMTKEFVDIVIHTHVKYRFSKGIFASTGLPIYWLHYVQGPRLNGEGKWNFRKLVKYGLKAIIAFTGKNAIKMDNINNKV